MPRPLRPVDKGLIYHVINRGNNHQNVFGKPEDFEGFRRSMRDLKERRPFEFYRYCLMTNLPAVPSASWIKALSRKPKLDLAICPGAARKKQPPHAEGSQLERKNIIVKDIK